MKTHQKNVRLAGQSLPERHYCVSCRRKRYLRYMHNMLLPYLRTFIWVCDECLLKETSQAKEFVR